MPTVTRPPRRHRLSTSALLLTIAGVAALGAVPARAATPVPGVRVTLMGPAVVNVGELARQQALGLTAPPPVRPLILPEFDDEGGEPGAVPGEPIAPGPPPGAPSGPLAPQVASPSPTLNFMGLDDIPMVDSSYIVIPPDVGGAVGLSRILEGHNNDYRVLDKASGATVTTLGTATFWAPTGTTLNALTDPRTLYDPYNDRWIAVMQSATSNGDILVGVSQTGDPAGAWFLYRFASGAVIDFPNVGFNKKWIVVAINRYSAGGSFQRGITLVMDYPQARAGVAVATLFTQAPGSHFASSPCVTYSAASDTEYVVTHLNSAGATYELDTITGTSSAPAYTSGGALTRTGGGWAQAGGNLLPQSAPVSGSSACATPCPIEAQDAQIRSAPVFRAGEIWYTQTVGLPGGALTHTAVQWTRLTTPSGAFVQGGRLEDATATSTNGGKWYAYPHIAVNAAGEFLIGFSQFSSAQHPGAGYAVHLAGDAAGSLRDPLIYKAGDDYYHKTFTTTTGRNRWGDFSTAQVDPADDQTLWTLQEYAKARVSTDEGNTGANGSRWSTWWAALGPPPLPTVAMGPGPSKAEGNAGTTAFRFPVSLSASSAQSVTVNYQTANGTATVADNDYQPATSSIVIPAGLTSDTIFVNVVGDTKSEANETFGVTLTGATNATLGAPASATGTILNDDALPALAIDDVSLAEGNSGTTAFTFTASLSAVSGQTVQVGYGTNDGTATLADGDYAAASGTATIPAGSLSAPITVLVNGDVTPEPNETFTVDLSSPVNATIADAQGVGTILNDDGATAVEGPAVTQFSLAPVAPNPALRGPVRIAWALPRDAAVRVVVLDVRGRELAVVAEGAQPAGWRSATFRPGAPGLYFVRMQAPGLTVTRRFAFLR